MFSLLFVFWCWGKCVVVVIGVVEGSIGWCKECVLLVYICRKCFCEVYLMFLVWVFGYLGKRLICDLWVWVFLFGVFFIIFVSLERLFCELIKFSKVFLLDLLGGVYVFLGIVV